MLLLRYAFVVVALLLPLVSSAQDTAQSDVSIERLEAVKISDIDDWDFGSWAVHDSGSPAVRLRDTTCVHSSTGSYQLTIDSANGTNRLRLQNGSGQRIRYNVFVRYNDGTGFTNQRVRSPATTITNMTGSLTLNCTGARNWNLRFTPVINKAQFNAAAPGIYQDVVTLTVSPE